MMILIDNDDEKYKELFDAVRALTDSLEYEWTEQRAEIERLNRAFVRYFWPSADPEILTKSVATMELSVRAHNNLKSEQIRTIGQLVACTERDLRLIPNMGALSIREIKNALAQRGLKLSTTPTNRSCPA